jgi:hypothetical protein
LPACDLDSKVFVITGCVPPGLHQFASRRALEDLFPLPPHLFAPIGHAEFQVYDPNAPGNDVESEPSLLMDAAYVDFRHDDDFEALAWRDVCGLGVLASRLGPAEAQACVRHVASELRSFAASKVCV